MEQIKSSHKASVRVMSNNQLNEWLDKEKIQAALSAFSLEHLAQLEILETVDSTNTYLLSRAKSYRQSGCVCLAEEQTKGRGRQGKEWLSFKGANIYCSLLWRFSLAQRNVADLSLAVAVMVMRVLARLGIQNGVQLKWPNDIYFANRKLAGILIEGLALQKEYLVVIGIGLNLQFPKHHPFISTSIGLEEILGQPISRNQLAGWLIDELLKALPDYTADGFSAFLPEWRKHDVLQGKSVVIHTPQEEIAGLAEGITEAGELVIRDQYGRRQTFRYGEVSVRLQSS